MCKFAYEKAFSKNNKTMIFCHRFDDKDDEAMRLCNYERYCGIKREYILEKPERCRFYCECDEKISDKN